jgi:flavin-dependent dehydrogenase
MVNPLILEMNARQRHEDRLHQAEKHRQIKQAKAKRRGADLGHAVVIGSGVAGLTAVRVLTDHFGRVTLVERDRLDGSARFRRGVPQARHAHFLLPSGQIILERLFPGLVDELLAGGAVAIDPGRDVAFFEAGRWHTPRARPTQMSVGVSRPLLEATLYRRVADHPRVRVIPGFEALGLAVDAKGQRVTGVRLRDRNVGGLSKTHVAADLVLDASGRGSRAALWLEHVGYTPPSETTIDALTGYASRVYRRPAAFSARWTYLFIRPTPPDGPRGGVIIPLEGERWHVTLFGMAADYPPTDEAGFLDFARSLPTPQLYDAIKKAEPLTRITGYRRTENHLRHYDALPRFLEGFLVTGDAVYTLNPVYALGMTAAALESQALDESLREQRRRRRTPDLTGLAATFQRRLRKAVHRPLRLTTSEDQRWPTTKVTERAFPARGRLLEGEVRPLSA